MAERAAGLAAGERGRLGELAWLFLRLGTTAFGGPAAHIAMMQDEVVRRRGWLSQEEFLDLLGATNLIPGPNSTEMAIHVGRLRAGWPGLAVAGACFILPAALIVTGLAWGYVHLGASPQAAGLLYGVKPVVIAVVAQALWSLGRAAVKSWGLAMVALAVLAGEVLGVGEIPLLALAGIATAAAHWIGRRRGSAAAVAPFGLWPLFVVFAKIGSVLYGSGYVLLVFLRSELVARLGWLTERQLLDAVAVGQVTPGPVFTTATFLGYVLGGGPGAVAATLGIFLPAFFFVAVSGPLIPRLRRSPTAGAVLDGVNVASLGLMVVVSWQLARTALVDVFTVLLAGVSLLLLVRYRINSAWLVLGGAVLGLVGTALAPLAIS